MEVSTHQAERSAIPLVQIDDCSEESQQPSPVSRLSKDSFLLHRPRGDVMCCVGDIGSQRPGHPVKILRGISVPMHGGENCSRVATVTTPNAGVRPQLFGS